MDQKNNYKSDEVTDDLPFYTENSTRLLYEVRFFEDFCIVRPASPKFYSVIENIPLLEFAERFTEYSGDHDELRSFIRDGDAISVN